MGLETHYRQFLTKGSSAPLCPLLPRSTAGICKPTFGAINATLGDALVLDDAVWYLPQEHIKSIPF
jgi:hypothetical protein